MSTSAVATPAAPAAPVPFVARPVAAVAAALLGAFLVGFDARLFTIALPDLRGAFHLSFDEGAWLSTAATAPQILAAPATAWLVNVFGLKRVFLGPSLVYAAIAVAMPFAHGFEMLLAMHIARGLLLGLFLPATITIIFRALPPYWWIPALAIYVFRLGFSYNTAVPIAGFDVQQIGWQWLYWQGALIAPIMGLLAWYGTGPRHPVDHNLLRRADIGGILLFGISTALIYAGIDQGNRLDWFNSGIVTSLLCGGAVLLVCFFINETLVPDAWAHYCTILKRNLLLGFSLILVFSLASASNLSLVPNFLVAVVGLRPEQSGSLLFLWTAVPLILIILVAVWLARRYDARLLMIIGLTAFAFAGWLGTGLTHNWAREDFQVIGLLTAMGQGFTFMGIIIFILANADPKQATAISAYAQVLRLDGAELAVGVMATWLRVREQIHSNLIGQHVVDGRAEVTTWLSRFTAHFIDSGGVSANAAARGAADLAQIVQREANVMSYIDGFELTFWVSIFGLLLVALMHAAPPGPLSPKR